MTKSISILFGLLSFAFSLLALQTWNHGPPFPLHSFPSSVSHNASRSYHPLSQLKFNNSFVDSFASDGTAFYSFIRPTRVDNPEMISVNHEVADLLGISLESTGYVAEYLSGNLPIPGYDPAAMAYAGHQFGGFTPRLGDGRASLLGEIYVDNENWALHAKGTGPTPYSRGGDGRAVLRSSIREFLCGEALHHLGIPSTRALSLVGSTLPVWRESIETAAVVVRVAPICAFVRFGTFELFASRGQYQHVEKLANYVVRHNYPHLARIENVAERFTKLLLEVAASTGELVAKWMAFGFSHGVLNTDNMSILSMTIDFGPFGFMDEYDPHFIPNHSDDEGRYAYDQQMAIGKWNLERLVDAFASVIKNCLKDKVTGTYEKYKFSFESLMRAKLGLSTPRPQDYLLWQELLDIMAMGRADYTSLFRKLADFEAQTNYTLLQACERNIDFKSKLEEHDQMNDEQCTLYWMIGGTFHNRKRFSEWAVKYSERLLTEKSQDAIRKISMNKINPKYILRNYMAHIAIENAKQGDFTEVNTLLHLLQHPFDEQPELEKYAIPAPEWGKKLELSCSS